METILLQKNNQFRQITGVDKFHAAGYYGERTFAATGETWDINEYNPDGLVSSPMNIPINNSTHAIQTAATFFQVAPKAHLAMFSLNGEYHSTSGYKSPFMEQAWEIIKELNITSMFVSKAGSNKGKGYKEDWSAEMQKLSDFCCTFSAGNDGEGSRGTMITIPEIYGAGGFIVQNGEIQMSPKSGSSENDYDIDFCGPFRVYYSIKPEEPEYPALINGTSFAAPWIAGMICLVNDFFIDKTGKPLTRKKMTQFLIDCCVDIEEEGLDKRSGYGIPCLPDPKDIDIQKYATLDDDNDNKEEDDAPMNEPIDIYNDKNEISSWAKDAVNLCTELGLMNGKGDKFAPKDPITREEMAVLTSRILEYLSIN